MRPKHLPQRCNHGETSPVSGDQRGHHTPQVRTARLLSQFRAPDAVTAAMALDHPEYDCFYLALAEQRDCRLVTADRRLLGRVRQTRWGKFVTALSDWSA